MKKMMTLMTSLLFATLAFAGSRKPASFDRRIPLLEARAFAVAYLETAKKNPKNALFNEQRETILKQIDGRGEKPVVGSLHEAGDEIFEDGVTRRVFVATITETGEPKPGQRPDDDIYTVTTVAKVTCIVQATGPCKLESVVLKSVKVEKDLRRTSRGSTSSAGG